MPLPTRRLPKYRRYKPKDLAVVRLDGRDVYLGRYDSPESHEKYRRVVAEWLASGRADLRGRTAPPPLPDSTVAELILAYWRFAERHYRDGDGSPSRELDNVRDALRPLRVLFGGTPAGAFGPLALRAVREEMIRSGLARTTVNARVNRIRRAFRWAASVELIPAAVAHALQTVPGLPKGRCDAREPDPVEPVPVGHVEAVLPLLPRPVAAMVWLQLLTGCRAGEVMGMRGCDLTRGEPNWEYRPARHKNAWRGQGRVIPLGPRARAVVAEFLKDDPAAHLFAPRDAVGEHHERRTRARKTTPTPSESARRCRARPGSGRAARYDRRTYRQAIVRACRRAGVPEWSPLQLRHTAATAIRARFGLEAAQTVLGHAKADTTEIYAARDLARAHDVMAQIG